MDTFAAAMTALAGLSDPARIGMLFLGVLAGLVIGIVPGLGGLVGLTLVLPFTFHMEPMMALSVMIGLHAVVATSDSIPAILFGVPGTVGSAATVLDGYPLAKQGDAGRALSAAFLSSLAGGIFGAGVLALSIPVMRPMMLNIGSPEILALCIFGLSLVVALSGRNILSGLMGVCLGLLFSLVGEDYQSGTMRWTFDTLYLWAGIPIVPFALGLFALPEIAEFVIKRTTIAGSVGKIERGWLAGARDVAANWTVVLRSSSLGALLGALPGIGSSIIDWVAYGSAVRAAKDSSKFGAGDIRGVIASEASNNAKEGGALIPTLAFGVPGSAAMAIMLGAFSIHGIIPGPDMLDKNLPVTFTLVFSLVLANVLGAGICFLFARQLAKIALVPVQFLAPVVIAITLLGALQGDKHWADLAVFFGAGLLGLAMRLAGWQRPPIILGFVLGILIERYFSTSYNVYGYAFLQRPLVLLFLALTAWGLLIPTLRRMSNRGGAETSGKFMLKWRPPRLDGQSAFAALFGFAFVVALVSAGAWPEEASRFAVIVASIGLTASIAFIGLRSTGNSSIADTNASDISLHAGEMPERLFRSRLVSYFIWTLAAFPMAYAAGPVAGVAVWTLAYMLAVFKVRMAPALATAGAIYLASHALFDLVLKVKWPVALFSGL